MKKKLSIRIYTSAKPESFSNLPLLSSPSLFPTTLFFFYKYWLIPILCKAQCLGNKDINMWPFIEHLL